MYAAAWKEVWSIFLCFLNCVFMYSLSSKLNRLHRVLVILMFLLWTSNIKCRSAHQSSVLNEDMTERSKISSSKGGRKVECSGLQSRHDNATTQCRLATELWAAPQHFQMQVSNLTVLLRYMPVISLTDLLGFIYWAGKVSNPTIPCTCEERNIFSTW